MWSWAIRLGRYALVGLGLTEIGAAATSNVSDMSQDVKVSAANVSKAARNTGIAVAIILAVVVGVTWFIKKPKRRGRR